MQQGIRDSLDLVDSLPERDALTKDFGDQQYLPCRDPKGKFYSFAPFFFRHFRDQQFGVFNQGEEGTPVAEVSAVGIRADSRNAGCGIWNVECRMQKIEEKNRIWDFFALRNVAFWNFEIWN